MENLIADDRLLLAIAIANAMECAEGLADAIAHMAENTATDSTDADAARAELEHLEVAWADAERTLTALRSIVHDLTGGGTSVRIALPITGVISRVRRGNEPPKTTAPKD